MKKTSWGKVSRWYHKSVGEQGHYYHKEVIFPNLLKLMDLRPGDAVLDIGCGQGVLSRQLSKEVDYVGVDVSEELIRFAVKNSLTPRQQFFVADVIDGVPIKSKKFNHVVFLLSLQNMEDAKKALLNASQYLSGNGRLYLVLNHPCFRIPRHTGWGIDEHQKMQYRTINRYMSPLEIPITMEPGRKSASKVTWSYHVPLSELSGYVRDVGLKIELIEEWVSNKQSYGKARKMENLARQEIPLFMCLVCS